MEKKKSKKSKKYHTLESVQKVLRSEPQIKEDYEKVKQDLDIIRQNILEEKEAEVSLQNEIESIEAQIKASIKQIKTIQEIASKKRISKAFPKDLVQEESILKKTIQQNEKLFCLLQQEPHYLSNFLPILEKLELDEVIDSVVKTIFADQYEAKSERIFLILLDQLLKKEADSCLSMETFLRANSAFTKLLGFYFRREQNLYWLQTTLAPTILEIIKTKNWFAELTPSKLLQKLQQSFPDKFGGIDNNISSKILLENPAFKSVHDENMKKTLEVSSKILDSVTANMQDLPFGIRWIAKRIKSICNERWPNAAANEINSLVGGMVFLRYITPAICTPTPLKVVEEASPSDCVRTFTFVGKILQNLSNGTYSNEEFMEATNPFLDERRSQLIRFQNDVCHVPELDEYMRQEIQVSHSQKSVVSIPIKISFKRLHNFHELLGKYEKKIANGDNDPLLLVLKEIREFNNLELDKDLILELNLGNSDHVSSYDINYDNDDENQNADFHKLREMMSNLLRNLPQLPDFARDSHLGFVERLQGIKKMSISEGNFALAGQISEIFNFVYSLTNLSKHKDSDQLWQEIASEILSTTSLSQKFQQKIRLAKKELKEIKKSRKQLASIRERSMQYLAEVEKSGGLDGSETHLERTFTERQLEDLRVIDSSNSGGLFMLTPRNISKFIFSTSDCNIFKISKVGHEQSVERVVLKDLLMRNENNETTIELGNLDMVMNLNPLITFLNSQFVFQKLNK
eukprot:c19853_g1_i1.p1 GENE.c19853_g1_i1~~c19853_g1_i1.p1  ORF type:complete len:744 (-),score=210.17 c19853_g1_i1:97-2328(-)